LFERKPGAYSLPVEQPERETHTSAAAAISPEHQPLTGSSTATESPRHLRPRHNEVPALRKQLARPATSTDHPVLRTAHPLRRDRGTSSPATHDLVEQVLAGITNHRLRVWTLPGFSHPIAALEVFAANREVLTACVNERLARIERGVIQRT
jgi:hypothetical protein